MIPTRPAYCSRVVVVQAALITEFILAGRAYQFPGSRQGIFRRAMTDVRTSMWHDTLKKYLQQFIPDDEYTAYQNCACVQEWFRDVWWGLG